MIKSYKKEQSTKSGVYIIRNIINNKIYIGSTTKTFSRRYFQHLNHLMDNNHCNDYLQKSWNKYGNSNFTFDILEDIINKNEILNREQYWLDYYKSYERNIGYNILTKSNNSFGYKHSEECKKRMSDLKIGKSSHPNTKKAVLLANTGKKRSQETKDKISRFHKGRKKSKESIEKLKLALTGKFMKNKRKILKLDFEFNIINIFKSSEECSSNINLSSSQIRAICNGRASQPLNYILLYEYYPIKSGRTDRIIKIKWRK